MNNVYEIVKIVRCKNCAYYDDHAKLCRYEEGIYHNPEFFCANGEPREGGCEE